MKSTQDLMMFLRALESNIKKEIQIIIGSDKSFVIVDNGDGVPDDKQILITADDLNCDINDLPYHDPRVVGKEIRDNLSVRDIRVEDL